MNKKYFALVSLIILFLIPQQSLNAQQSVDLPDNLYEQKGLFVRAGLGLAWLHSEPEGMDEINAKGYVYNFRGGYRFSNKAAIHALYSGSSFPKIGSSGISVGSLLFDINEMEFTAIGGGFDFYFGQGYSYIMLEFASVSSRITINNGNYDSESGIGVTFSMGYDYGIISILNAGLSGFIHFNNLELQNSVLGEPKEISNIIVGFECSFRLGR